MNSPTRSSAAWVVLLWFSMTLVCVTAQPTRMAVCFLGRYGQLNMFNEDKANVAVPCKFRMADFTCGNYRVKVTPKADIVHDRPFSVQTLWVKVEDLRTNDTLRVWSSQRRLEKYQAGEVDSCWRVQSGKTYFLDFAGFDPDEEVAELSLQNVFSIQFSYSGVYVSCQADPFEPQRVPNSLCGDAQIVGDLNESKKTMLGEQTNVTDQQFLHYVIMTEDNIKQRENCEELANRFQKCDHKEQASVTCEKIFGDSDVSSCLGKKELTPYQAYDKCLEAVCGGDNSAMQSFSDCM